MSGSAKAVPAVSQDVQPIRNLRDVILALGEEPVLTTAQVALALVRAERVGFVRGVRAERKQRLNLPGPFPPGLRPQAL
ncbi:MAG TPA: hypothetical protein VGG49_13155 [Steroidobacteraceae bacterium]